MYQPAPADMARQFEVIPEALSATKLAGAVLQLLSAIEPAKLDPKMVSQFVSHNAELLTHLEAASRLASLIASDLS
jgi:hypothetical protein